MLPVMGTGPTRVLSGALHTAVPFKIPSSVLSDVPLLSSETPTVTLKQRTPWAGVKLSSAAIISNGVLVTAHPWHLFKMHQI